MLHSRYVTTVPPGETARKQLENRRASQKEFALGAGVSEKHMSHLINGETGLTPEVSLRPESVLRIPAKF